MHASATEGAAHTIFQDLRATLHDLLKQLFAGTDHDFERNPPSLDLITLEDILARYPLTGLGGPAQAAIAQSQRLIRAGGDYVRTGLLEFHVGLIYLHWDQGHRAAGQFARARQQWSLSSNTAYECLALVAQACTEILNEEHEAAMGNLRRAQRHVLRLRQSTAPHPARDWLEDIEDLIESRQKDLKDHMWPGDQREPAPAAAPPPVLPGSTTPLPGHQLGSGPYAWYQVVQRHQDNFLPRVAPLMWLLVDRSPDTYQHRDLLVISHAAHAGSITLRPLRGPAPTGRQLSLGSLAQQQALTAAQGRGRVTLSAREPRVSVEWDDIEGRVVGFWTALDLT